MFRLVSTRINAAVHVALVCTAALLSAQQILGALAVAAPAETLRIESPIVRETLPGQTVGSAYLVIHNDGSVTRRLLSASTPAAREAQMHDMSLRDGVMRMRQITDGVVVPAHGKVVFEPGGMHLMLVGLQSPLITGTRVPLTLRFDRGLALSTSLQVVSIADEISISKK